MKKEEATKQLIKEISEITRKKEKSLINRLNDIADTAAKFIKCSNCSIWLFNEKMNVLVLSGSSNGHRRTIVSHINKFEGVRTWEIFETKREKVLDKSNHNNVLCKDKYLESIYPNINKTGVPFIGIPIILHHQTIGVLTFSNENIHYVFTDDSLNFAKIISRKIAHVLDKKDLHFKIQELYNHNQERLKFLSEFSNKLLKCRTLNAIYRLTCETTKKKLNYRTSSIFLWSKEGKLERKYIAGFSKKNEPPVEFYERMQGLVGLTSGSAEENHFGQPHLCNDYEKETFIYNDPIIRQYAENYKNSIRNENGIEEKIKHVITVPLNAFYRTVGVIKIVNKIDIGTNQLSELDISEFEKDWLFLIANLVSTAITNLKMLDFRDLTLSVNERLTKYSEKSIYNYFAKVIISETRLYSNCIIRILNTKTGKFEIKGISGEFLDKNHPKLKIGEGFVGKTFFSDNENIIKNFNNDPQDYKHIGWAKQNNFVSLICFPLKNINKTINYGTISIFTKFEFVFSQGDIRFLQDFVNQISNTIQIIQEKRQLELINEISEKINKENKVVDIFRISIKHLPLITGYDGCSISKVEHNVLVIKESSDKSQIGYELPIDTEVLKVMLQEPNITRFNNVQNDIRFNLPKVKKTRLLRNIKSMVCIPIFTDKTNKLYGFITLVKIIRREEIKHGRYIKNNYRDSNNQNINSNLFNTLANLLGTAIEKNETIRSFQITANQKQLINELILNISKEEDLDKNLKTILDELINYFKCKIGYISLLSKTSKYIIPTHFHNIGKKNFPALEIGGASITGWIYNNKKAYIYPSHMEIDKFYIGNINLDYDIKTELIAPFIYKNEVIGFIALGSDKDGFFKKESKEFVESLANQIATNIQNKKFHYAALKLAEIRFDSLNVDSICTLLAKKANEIMETKITCIWLKKNNNGIEILTLKGWDGVDIKNIRSFDMLKEGGGVSWNTIISKKEESIVENLKNSFSVFKHPKFAEDNDLEAMLSVPLISGKNIIGVINIFANRKYGFLDKEVSLLKTLAMSGAIAINNAKLTEEIREASKLKDEFLSKVSHDVRTPINSILLNTELIKKSDRYPELSENLESIGTSTTVLLDLIDDILTYSVLKEGKFELDYKPTNISSIIKEIDQIFEIPIKNKAIKFINKSDDKLPKSLLLDNTRIRQILINLISNAQKYTDKGYIKFSTNVNITSDYKTNLIFEVEDTGIGIPKDKKAKIFNAFEMIHKEKSKGIGLGLSIVKQLVDKMGGKIELISEEGKGSKFTITIPDVEMTSEKPISESKFDTDSIIFNKATLLIVDDNKEPRQNIIKAFRDTNITVIEAGNGKEGIEKAIESKPDIIFMDIIMPVINGIEATKNIKSEDDFKNIPIIAYSTSKTKNVLGDDLKIFDGYICKTNKDIIGEFYKYMINYISYKEVKDKEFEFDYNNISSKTKKNLHKIIKDLENNFIEESNDLGIAILISDVIEFSEKIINYSIEKSFPELEEYGKKLKEFAYKKDVVNIKILSNNFRIIIENLKKKINK